MTGGKENVMTWWRKQWKQEGTKFFSEYRYLGNIAVLSFMFQSIRDAENLDCKIEQIWANKQGLAQ